MQLQEVVLCSTSSQDPTAGAGAIVIHDIQTGAVLASFKQTNAGPRGVAVLESRSTQGGFMLAAQSDKSILNVYNYQKDQLALKIVLPEKLSCIAVDVRGDFCAAGTSQGRIYLWEISSGILYNAWDAHYRAVNVLRFTSDGAALVSGSDDSGVSVWSVSRLVNEDLQQELPAPFCTLTDHTLPVTDIVYGLGVFPNCRILTASADHSVKVWDLSTKSLLTTFQFPHIISMLAWDTTERFFFAVSAEGSIYQINMFRQKPRFGGQAIQAVGGLGTNDVVRIDEEYLQSQKKRLIQVGQPVSAISISLSATWLLVGTASGHIHIYDIPSHQLLRSISAHKGFSITHLQTMMKPPDLSGHISIDFKVGASADLKDTIPVKSVVPFQRTRDAKAREAHEVLVLLKDTTSPPPDFGNFYGGDEFLKEHAFFVQPVANDVPTEVNSVSLQSRVHDLENEVEQLRSQLGKAKGVNDTMWDTVVKRLVDQGKPKESEDSEESKRNRKRGRTGN
ncbi:pre-rRNA-processing protein IPI3 [Ephemerocybe angulata]|uniref:Pre-rRNA-processing protein IPI3 n=1 Tax=Ephemerocybe angulata TaxID=980116 RepID=A0A8H6MD64_9AGAR|nr:pre-rRNA-processing protein IPI3 [Tulosesus angulatus]